MRTFIIVWIGQLVSSIGSKMTSFAVTIWVWELTGQATALTLVGFFGLVPSILTAPLAGIFVDRWNRKRLMIIGDTVAVGTTFIILLLYLANDLQTWHLYVIGAINGAFEQLQALSYSASISMIVPKSQYTRASSLGFLSGRVSQILAPALAGFLYYAISFLGIILIDILTFLVAIGTVLFVRIPQPLITEAETLSFANIRQQLKFGLDYIKARPSLLALLTSTSLFWLPHDLGNSLYSPMILARTGSNAVVLGSLAAAAGVGGVTGALLTSIWGGPKRRIHGILLGMVGASLSKAVFGLGRTPLIWIPAQFCSSFHFPVMGSSRQAIWLSKVSPDAQGRVFATDHMLRQLALAVAFLIAGPLADYSFEPAMRPSGSLAVAFSGIFGTGRGAGMALMYVICAFCMLLVGLGGYAFRTLRDVEDLVPDHNANSGSG